MENKWFLRSSNMPNADYRLFCFPHAGGSGASYLSWKTILPVNCELIAIQPPGRANRVFEPPFTEMDKLISELMLNIRPLLDKPYILLGHSMGSKVAFELINRLQKNRLRLPIHFIASGSAAPNIKFKQTLVHDLPDAKFLQKLRELEGTPIELLNNQEMMSLCLPTLRADFKISETYENNVNPRFPISVDMLGGITDPSVGYEGLSQWNQYFASNNKPKMFNGGHFFINSERDTVVTEVARIIEQQFFMSQDH